MAKKTTSPSEPPTIDAEIVSENEVQALALRPKDALAIQRAPDKVLEEARKAAVVLQGVIESKPDKIVFNKKTYLTFEDWQTLGRFYGYTVMEDGDPEPVAIGDAQGFKASAVVIDAAGALRSRATSYCMNDEEKWSSRPKYAYVYVLKGGGTSVEDPGKDKMLWVDHPTKKKPDGSPTKMPKKERLQIGVERVPIFQLASMAQTRACAKAMRNVMAWVAVLAGYSPTPAEELDSKDKQMDQGIAPEDENQDPPLIEVTGTVYEFKEKVKNSDRSALKIKWTPAGKEERVDLFEVINPNFSKALTGRKGEKIKITASAHQGDKGIAYFRVVTLLAVGKYDFSDPDSIAQFHQDMASAQAPAAKAEPAAAKPAETKPAETKTEEKPAAAPAPTTQAGGTLLIEDSPHEITVGRGKNKTTKQQMWFKVTGIVSAISEVREVGNTHVRTFGIDGLPDYRQNPAGRNNRFDSYHKTLLPVLTNVKKGSRIVFRFFPETSADGKKITQYVEDILEVDAMKFKEGKVVEPEATKSTAASPDLFGAKA